MAQQIPVDDAASAPAVEDGPALQLAPDIAYRRLAIINVAFLGGP